MIKLHGRTILITRAAHQYESIATLVRSHGGQPISLPCLEVQALPPVIIQSLPNLKKVSDVLFTSTNAVRILNEVLLSDQHLPTLNQVLEERRIASVGKKTTEFLKSLNIQADITASTESQLGLIEAYRKHGLPKSLIFYRAEEGSDRVINELQSQGVNVRLIKSYRSICPQNGCGDVRRSIEQGKVDVVLLASSRTAKHYVQRIANIDVANIPRIIVISQQVANAASKLGLQVDAIARETSFNSMLEKVL